MPTNQLASDTAHEAPDRAAENHAARRAALACMVTLAVALGIGRFAFTPLLPLMLHGSAYGQPQIDIQHGGWLASFNYAGYFVGAVACAALRRVEAARMVRAGLVLTVLLTLAMGVTSQFWVWAVVRFIAGAVSAWTFVFASQWGLRRLHELGAHGWGGVIYTGPGVGIAGTGLLVSAAGGFGPTVGWIGFGLIAAVLSVVVWSVFGGASDGGAANASLRKGAAAADAATARAATERAVTGGAATQPTAPHAAASRRAATQPAAFQHAASQHATTQRSATQRPTTQRPTTQPLTTRVRTAPMPSGSSSSTACPASATSSPRRSCL